MRAVRGLIAFLLLISLGFSLLNISGNQSSYNPGSFVSLTLIIGENTSPVDGRHAYVNFTNGAYNFICNSTAWYSPNVTSASCMLPANLVNGSWVMNITTESHPEENNTANFTINRTNMIVNISSPKSFPPGAPFIFYVSTTYGNGEPFNITASNFSVVLNVSGAANCSSLTFISSGYYNGTCTVNITANASNYQFNGTYPNSNATDVLSVNVSYNIPNIVANNTGFNIERGNSTYVNITIRSNSNVNETMNVSIDCDGLNLTCTIYSGLPLNQTTVAVFGITNVTVNITAMSGSTATSYSLNVSVTSWNEIAHLNRTTLSVIINPAHAFTLTSKSAGASSAMASQNVSYTFNVSNTGESSANYNFSCQTNSSHFRCSFNASNSTPVQNGSFIDVNLTVTVLYNAYLEEDGMANVTVNDHLGLSSFLEPATYYKTRALANLGNVTVTNATQYVHYAGETYYFNVSINNTGNWDGNDTIFNISVTAYNSTWLVLSGGYINVSSNSDFSGSYRVNDTSGVSNFTLNIGNLSSKNISVKVFMPASASCQNSTILYVYANSSKNASRFYNSTIIVKIPCFSFSVVMNYSNSTGYLNFSIINISKEGSAVTSFSNLTFFIIINQTSTVMANNTNATLNMIYVYDTSNVSAWASGGYVLNINGSTPQDTPYNLSYNFSFRGVFYIARWINFTMPTTLPSTASGQNFSLAITSAFGNTSIATNVSGSSQKPVINYFIGGTCPGPPSISGTTFTYTCTATGTTNTTYTIKARIIATSCSSDFTCTFIPEHFANGSSTINETYSPGTTGDGQQGAPPSGNATNRTTTTTTGIKITIPMNVTLLNTSQTVYITLNNTNTSRQNVSVNISEASDYIHFSLTYVAPKNISGNSTSTVNITLTPFKWAKPGSYTVTVTINSANSTFTVTVPQPNDTKKIHRYVEVSKNRATSMVTLSVKNRNGYSAFMNVTENISKQIASSAKNVTIISAVNYTIIEEDPVIMWMMNMSSNQEKSIIYLVAGDLGNSNLFKEPNVTEGRMSAGGGGGGGGVGGDMTWLIIGIIVVVVIAVAVVVYLFFLKPRGIKLPIDYRAFVKQEKKGEGVLGVLKGITAKIMSVFKRGEKKEGLAVEKKSIFSRLSFKKKVEVKEEPKKEEKKIAPGKPKPTKEDLLKKLNEVYKK